jgi:acyl-coenzyme A thioesterase PaaI-like protein
LMEAAEGIVRGEVAPPPVARLVGFEIRQIEPGLAVMELEAGERHHNPMGTVHVG